ncbi:MAG: AAA family ATPase [Myxococcota bacterium]
MLDVDERSPVWALNQHLGGRLQRGEVAFIAARAGVGKSVLLVHMALDRLLHGRNVLHVALEDTVDNVRAHYDQVFRAASDRARAADRASAMVAAERHRMIHTWQGRGFTVEALERSLDLLAEMASFEPELVVVDGVPPHQLEALSSGLAQIAKTREVALWFTVRETDTPAASPVWDHVRLGLRLAPESRSVRIARLDSSGNAEDLPLSLDPATMVVLKDDDDVEVQRALVPRSADCTLYSGGANGSEAAFGEIAEQWGLQEVNFTFDGHKQVRDRGQYLLSPRELAAGDVSLVYVSRRLSRTYSEGTLIRRVLQTLWHMVSRSQQIFVVGQIQEDGTVVGGTGWSVELARMWNKALWVFDQDQDRWFRWENDEWVAGTPVIESLHLTGTGTRYIKPNGRAAIEELFKRSFSTTGA